MKKRKFCGAIFLVVNILFITDVQAESLALSDNFRNSIIFLDDIICGGEGVLQVIKFVMMLLDLVCAFVPIGLILMMILDFVKNIIAGNADEMKKNAKIVFKRVITAVALFLVPTIVNFMVILLGNLGVDYAECIRIATTEDLSQYKIEYNLDDLPKKDVELSSPSGIKVTEKQESSSDKSNSTSEGSGSSGNQSSDDGSTSVSPTSSISVKTAKTKYADELKRAYVKYESDTIFVAVNKATISGNSFYVTHIVVENASQIFGEPANGSYANGLEKTSSAVSRLNKKGKKVIVGINGSHFNYSDGSEDLSGANHIAIVNGKAKKSGTSGGMEILLKNDGTLYTASGVNTSTLISNGVKYSFSSHDTHFIENGALANDVDSEDANHGGSYSYYSTVIGMVSPRNYYILTGTSTNRAAANYLLEKGCFWAKSMDQGGSVSLVVNGKLINASFLNGERAVGDFLMFSE